MVGVGGRSQGGTCTSAGTQRVLSEFECDEVEDGEGSEASLKDFTIKASLSEMVSLWEGREKTVGIKLFLTVGKKF